MKNILIPEELKDCLAEAINPETPSYRLKLLASHEAWLVRSLVAKNPSTPSVSIEHLVQDSNQIVRDSAYYGRRYMSSTGFLL
jgi:hypothetical protein